MKSFTAIIIFFALCILACQDTREEDIKDTRSTIAYYKSVGEQISLETGMRWIEFYKKKSNQTGRTSSIAIHSIPAAQMEAMLQSVPNLTGVAFHYGRDVLGIKHIIAIPFDQSLSLWSDIPGRIYIDTNTGNSISQSVASAWAQNFKTAHPNEIWFHFFGAEIFNEITAISYFNKLDIEPAINDLNLAPQLLLLVWNEISLLGRTNNEEGRCYDASNPCPPCAVH